MCLIISPLWGPSSAAQAPGKSRPGGARHARNADVQRHKLLSYTHANNAHEMRFNRDGASTIVTVTSLLDSDDGQILRAAALDGIVILVTRRFDGAAVPA